LKRIRGKIYTYLRRGVIYCWVYISGGEEKYTVGSTYQEERSNIL
jgi:hypothetical protein